ncbi:MAG TPA: glycine cleavage system protein GcvH [Parachlamydiaceae bacterium]|nr:glycine cleavage system protein GcvH [Parachlamydiaceae bacterium]
MKFTKTHEWVLEENGIGTVGVTDYAQDQLGDIVYVELPAIGKHVKLGEEAAVLESTKAAADVYSPVTGTVVEVNQELAGKAELVNQSAEGQGWLFKIKLEDPSELSGMLNETEYKKL